MSAHALLNDLHTATGNLHVLLSVLYEVGTDIQYLLPTGERDQAAERVSALTILARDEAERIDEAVGNAITADKPSTGSMKSLFKQWIELRDEANVRAEKVSVAKDLPGHFDKANRALEKVLAEPATSLQDLAMKLIAVTDHGAYMDLSGFTGGADLIREAAALVGRSEHLEGAAK